MSPIDLVSPSVAYWLSSFEPEMEAIAGEVALLRRHFPDSVSWGVSPSMKLQWSKRGGYAFHPRLHYFFRGLTWLRQGRFSINHLFGGLGDWFHLRALRDGPSILTLAVHAEPTELELLSKLDRFVVEWPRAREQLLTLGIPCEHVRLIPPPVDLVRFKPEAAPARRFTVLFASAPERADWLTARGIDLILQAAQLRPNMFFRLLWRPWGDSLPVVRHRIGALRLPNVEVVVERVADMAAQYAAADVTVFPGVDASRCKPMPNSIVESLASGRPVVVSERMEIQDYLVGTGAGEVVGVKAEDLAAALDRLQANWKHASGAARALAEESFDQDRFIAGYQALYHELS